MNGLLLGLLWVLPAQAAQPNPKPAAGTQAAVDGDKLPPGEFAGTLVSLPNSERMFTLKITYPEVRLKPGAKMPSGGNVHMPHVQNMNRQLQQLQHLQQQMARNATPHHAVHNMMQMQQMFIQMQRNQQRMAQQEMQMMARIQQQQIRAEQQLMQQELKLLQQQIKAIQNMYQVVQVTRNFDFQADENLKVRMKDLPEPFDDKGNIKKYTKQERLELKGKDKNLPGYESSADSLQIGQVVLVALRVHKKPKPTATLGTSSVTDKDKDKDADKDKDKDKEADSTIQHRMQVRLIVILKDSDMPQNSTTQPTKKK